MHHTTGFLVAAAALVGPPAHALQCTDIQALVTAEVAPVVVQRVVYEAPPEDGWDCFEAAELSVADLDMAIFFARLDANEALRWQVRAGKCDAGQEVRAGAKRLRERIEAKAAGTEPPLDEEETAPATTECLQVKALQEAIAAR